MNRAAGDPCVSGGMWDHRGSRPRTQTPGRIVVSRGLLHCPPCLLPIGLLAKAPRPSQCSGIASEPSFPVHLPAWAICASVGDQSCLSVHMSVRPSVCLQSASVSVCEPGGLQVALLT